MTETTTETTTQSQDVLAKERQRIAEALVPYARAYGWCDDFLFAWRAAFGDDVPEPRDADGVSADGWVLDPDGTAEYDSEDPEDRRPVRPSLSHDWQWTYEKNAHEWVDQGPLPLA